MMRTVWIIRLVVILLMAVSCSAVLADCHGGDCHEDSDCCGMCVHACRCALIEHCYFVLDSIYTSYSPDESVQILTSLGTDIFRPPQII